MGDPYKWLYIWLVCDRFTLRRTYGGIQWFDASGVISPTHTPNDPEEVFVRRWFNG